MEGLLSALATMSGEPSPVVLENFGVFIAPALMNIYGHLIPGDWRTVCGLQATPGDQFADLSSFCVA
jgi:hypothetical protein